MSGGTRSAGNGGDLNGGRAKWVSNVVAMGAGGKFSPWSGCPSPRARCAAPALAVSVLSMSSNLEVWGQQRRGGYLVGIEIREGGL